MKTNKKALAMLTAGLLVATPVISTGLTVFAADHTLTITDTENVAHTYNAYQIMTGTLNEGKLTELQWGTGVTPAALISELNTNKDTLGINTLATDASAQTVGEELAKIKDASKKELLAKIFNESGILTSTKTELTKGTGDNASKYTATLTDGWYLVIDSSTLDNTNGPKVRSANLLQIVGNTSIDTKHSLPTLTKKIIDKVDSDNDNVLDRIDANTAAIGDIVTYEIKTQVPDVTGYNKYFFVVEDTLSAGLTYNATSISVKIGSTELTKDTDGHTDSEKGKYYVETEGTTKIKVVFEDFLAYIKDNSINKDTDITITYTATLNNQANTSPSEGNPNKAKLIYSNDPNVTYTGTPGTTPDEPKPPVGETPGEVVGETPEDIVKTYTTAIKIKKVDQDGQPLKGATFKLTGSNLKEVLIASGATFTVDNTNGTYWKLKNNSYTTTDPATLSSEMQELYDSKTTKYTKTPTAATAQEATLSGTDTVVSVSATVDDSGILTFTGLNVGNYVLEEIGVPANYNKADNISFTIGTSAIDENSVTWTKSNDNNKVGSFDTTDNLFPVTIENRMGSTLPTTGGIGTKLFYIIGSMLVAGSIVLLVTKKRMGAKED